MLRRTTRRAAFTITIIAGLVAISIAPPARSVRTPESTLGSTDVPGTDILHVPMAWCILNGSPAQAAPNITSEGSAVADTDTDAVIWRRHERPTDNIFLPQATISLRSAINNAWGTFNFPLLADPNLANGQPGDVNGWNVNTDGAEFTALINNCDAAYAAPAVGRAGIGITAVNVGLFHDNANPASDMNAQMNYVGVIGWGGCNEVPAGTCGAPFDGRIMVIDNNYLYPTVADRTFPPSPADPGGSLQFNLTDPLDQLVGHEVGHALSLDHRASTTALMNPTVSDNNADARIDNIGLNAAEIAALRANANGVPGLEIDPPAVFTPGVVLSMRLPDGPRAPRLGAHLDLASMRAALDTRRQRLYLGQQLWGLLPCKPGTTVSYGYLADLDANAATGAAPARIRALGIPTAFRGADLVAKVDVVATDQKGQFKTCHVRSRVWVTARGALTQLPPTAFVATIQTLRMHPHFAPIKGVVGRQRDFVADVYNTIQLNLANARLPRPVRPNRPFRANAVTVLRREAVDGLGARNTGGRFILQSPRFPHCFPAGPGRAGGTIDVRFDGLRPNTEIHALVGPDLVLRGVFTDSNGAGQVALPIPRGARPGLHLVTIGHDRLALTADCTITVDG